MSTYFTAWSTCDCTDIQTDRNELPDTCPEHGGQRLGMSEVAASAGTTKLGHICGAA